MRFTISIALSLLVLASACSSDDSDTTTATESTTDTETIAGPDSGEADGGDGSGPDDDAADIVGNPDLDLEELAEVAPDAAEALQDIAGSVSIGDCSSDVVGLAMTYVPDGWQCRVLDEAVGGLDGFTLFMPQNPGGIEITVGTPSPLGSPCEALSMCDAAESIDLGDNFDMVLLNVGVPLIYGTHKTVEAEAAVVMTAQMTDADREFITMVLDGVQEL